MITTSSFNGTFAVFGALATPVADHKIATFVTDLSAGENTINLWFRHAVVDAPLSAPFSAPGISTARPTRRPWWKSSYPFFAALGFMISLAPL